MTDLLTPSKGLTQPATGSHFNEWGTIVNANFGLIDASLGGTLALAITGNTALTATQAQNTGYNFTGSLGTTTSIIFPAYYGLAVISNNTNQSLVCGVTGGTAVTIPSGFVGAIWSDGRNFLSTSSLSQSEQDQFSTKVDWQIAINALGTLTSPTLFLDATNNHVNTMTLMTSITSFTMISSLNPNTYASVVLKLTQGPSGGPYTVTWPTTFRWQGGYSPALQTAAGAVDVVQAITFDAGTTWYATIAMQIPPA